MGGVLFSGNMVIEGGVGKVNSLFFFFRMEGGGVDIFDVLLPLYTMLPRTRISKMFCKVCRYDTI